MFLQAIKIIWFNKRTTGWLFAELIVVLGIVWFLVDGFIVNYRTYYQPLGFDITNTYRLKLAGLSTKDPSYIPDEERKSSEGEDLIQLMNRLRQQPEVEEVCATFYSCPYSFGNLPRFIEPIGGDTLITGGKQFQLRLVTPEYFKVFNVKDKSGNPLFPQIEKGSRGIIISENMEKMFFKGQEGKGRFVTINSEPVFVQVLAVSENMRISDYEISQPCFFEILQGETYNQYIGGRFNPTEAEICVKMKEAVLPGNMLLFLEGMGESLKVNNLYVKGAISLKQQRADKLMDFHNGMKNKLSLVGFLLLNVVFGIVGTFWVHMRRRRNEIGLRFAVGASAGRMFRDINLEGLVLLVLTLPFLFFISLTIIRLDIPDSYRMPFTIGRYVLSMGITYMSVACMVCIGVSFPAWKAMKTPPAEALHYE